MNVIITKLIINNLIIVIYYLIVTYFLSKVRYHFLEIISDEECEGQVLLQDGEFCTIGGIDNPEKYPCRLDNGSTLAEEIDGNITLIGLSTFSGCNTNNPSVFVRISLYLDWIKEVTDLP